MKKLSLTILTISLFFISACQSSSKLTEQKDVTKQAKELKENYADFYNLSYFSDVSNGDTYPVPGLKETIVPLLDKPGKKKYQ
ncbi:hypothetical protein [Vagococcus bubulae]|uniref:Uncharacterized protein n=1 Tax=Vagococcus bubulae TaxID=1977868 RepID=A0A429ZQC0_9ENTE|nr:hypothetical protein [Vagococcus bubulae]RST95887.1 hypothetical protein CBF36_01585 [Vagococcus bubulae]